MARRKSTVTVILRNAKEANKQAQARQQAQTKAAKEAERARQAYIRAQEQAAKMAEKERKAQEKENARLYVESRVAEVNLKNEQLEQEIERLENLLADALSRDSFIELETLKQNPAIPTFHPGQLDVALEKPRLEKYLPEKLTGLKKLVPGATQKYEKDVAVAHEYFEKDMQRFKQRELERQQKLSMLKDAHDRKVDKILTQAAAQNAEIDQLQQELNEEKPAAIVK